MNRTLLSAVLGLSLCAAASAAWGQIVPPPKLDPAEASAGTYVLDPSHASVIVRVRHLGLSDYAMSFGKIQAQYVFDPKAPAASKVEVTIDANSLDTGVEDHGARFAKEFLGADKHPQITFVSTAISPGANGKGTISGDLTLNGVSKPVTLDVDYRGALILLGAHRMGFAAHGALKRSEFGSTALKGIVGDDIDIAIAAEFTRK